jgi:tetratricopeptide (TPR) repeat protein
MARRDLLNGDRDLAYESLKKAIHLNPTNDAAYYEISRIAQYSSSTKALNKALEYGETAVELDADNVWYHRNLIGIYKRQKDFESAAEEAKKIIEIQPNQKDNYYQLANMYIYGEDYKSALKVYADMERKFGFEEGIILQQKQIYLKLGDYSKALKQIDKLIAHSPTTKKYYGMAADIQMATGDYDGAYDNIQKILAIDPNDGRVHLVLADYYRMKGDQERSFKEVKTALGTPSLEIDTKIKVLMKYFQASVSDESKRAQAVELMDTVLVANPNEPKALAMKADFLNSEGNYKEAIVYFRKVIAVDSTRYLVWEQMLLVEQRLEDYPAMANESSRALRMFPQQPSLYYFSGLANIEIKNYALAEEHLKMGLNFVFDSKYKSDFYGLLAEAEFRQHKFGPAEDHFSRAVKGNPLNARALKDYAYFLAYYDKDLANAKRMASTAMELKPADVDYIYTYGYVLFKNGEIDQAKSWVRKALVNFPDSKKIQLLDQEVNKNE